jgi:hypothetical protein
MVEARVPASSKVLCSKAKMGDIQMNRLSGKNIMRSEERYK